MKTRTPQQVRASLLERKFCPAESLDIETKSFVCYEDGNTCRYPNTRLDCKYFREHILPRAIRSEIDYGT